MSGTLYIVATPIGNLGDMTVRAIDTLKQADLIACEDTRTSARLLQYFGIQTPTTAYHEHNADSQTGKLIEKLLSGQSLALISDAGTPLISDPGFRLVQAAHEHNLKVVPIVGACAMIAALSAAGLASDKFSFIGFLPAKSHGRQKLLQAWQEATQTLIFYEAPHRIVECLTDMLMIFGNRQATLCRELTKTFETIKKLPLQQLLEFVTRDCNQQKGEIVLVVEGHSQIQSTKEDYDHWLLRIADDLPPKKAAAIVADVLGLKKSQVYERLLTLQQKQQTNNQ